MARLIIYRREGSDTHSSDHLTCLILMLQKVIPVTSAARVYTGPRVQGTHPVLVSFETYSDRSVEELEGFIQKKMCIFADRSY